MVAPFPVVLIVLINIVLIFIIPIQVFDITAQAGCKQ